MFSLWLSCGGSRQRFQKAMPVESGAGIWAFQESLNEKRRPAWLLGKSYLNRLTGRSLRANGVQPKRELGAERTKQREVTECASKPHSWVESQVTTTMTTATTWQRMKRSAGLLSTEDNKRMRDRCAGWPEGRNSPPHGVGLSTKACTYSIWEQQRKQENRERTKQEEKEQACRDHDITISNSLETI